MASSNRLETGARRDEVEYGEVLLFICTESGRVAAAQIQQKFGKNRADFMGLTTSAIMNRTEIAVGPALFHPSFSHISSCLTNAGRFVSTLGSTKHISIGFTPLGTVECAPR